MVGCVSMARSSPVVVGGESEERRVRGASERGWAPAAQRRTQSLKSTGTHSATLRTIHHTTLYRQQPTSTPIGSNRVTCHPADTPIGRRGYVTVTG